MRLVVALAACELSIAGAFPAAGTSKADFVASRPTADLAAAYEGGYQVMKPERFLDLVYEDLAR